MNGFVNIFILLLFFEVDFIINMLVFMNWNLDSHFYNVNIDISYNKIHLYEF